MNTLTRVVVLLVFGILAWPSEAEACSCAIQGDVRDALKQAREQASLVFHGRVDAIQESFGEDGGGPRIGRTSFTVLETFKGKAAPQRTLDLSDSMCERLTLNPPGHGARVTCENPSGEQPLCDEKATRRASWGPVEAPPRGLCHWSRADAPSCEWDAETVPLAPGAPTRPGLVCTTGPRGNTALCRVVPDAATPPPATDSP